MRHDPTRPEPAAAASTAAEVPPRGAVARSVVRWRDGRSEVVRDRIAEEVPIALSINGDPFAVMMATPADLDDFARGLVWTEGLVADPRAVRAVAILPELDHIAVTVHVDPDALTAAPRERSLLGRSGCGVCGSRRIEDVVRPPVAVRGDLRLDGAAIERALGELQQHQALNAVTGATHAAAWADADGRLHVWREDVGRHNALDKTIGALHRLGAKADRGFFVVTSRASYEMVQKAASAGAAILVAVSAPTALAMALADTAGMTLVGFARARGCSVYSHPSRIVTSADVLP